jgi:glutamate/tyrosine decarboxylase-like PLP-dependent enzyme
VERNVEVAEAVAREIAASPDFEACPAEPELSVVCFRHLPAGQDAADQAGRDALDVHQDALQAALERSGRGFVTTTRLQGRTWLRAGILNYMASEADAAGLLEDLRQLASEMPPAA